MAKHRREQRHAKVVKERQKLMLWGVAGVAVLAVIAVILVILTNRPAPIPEGVVDNYEGIEQGMDANGYPRLGRADAPIVVEEFSSFACPACKQLHDTQFESILDDVRAGYVQVIFKPISTIPQGSDARNMARAALCATDQGKFWEMHDVIFHWQGAYDVNSSRLRNAAESLGLNADDIAACYNSNQQDRLIQTSEAEFAQLGFNSTPRVVVDRQEIANWGALTATVADRKDALGIGG